MRDSLSRVYSSERLAHAILDHEVPQRDNDFSDQECQEHDHPAPTPLNRGQSREENRVDHVTECVQSELSSDRAAACWKTCAPFMIVERVECAEASHRDDQVECRAHRAESSGINVPW